MTLLLLVLAASVMVAIGRASMAHALAAREAQQDIQRRWGEASCRQAVLPFAEPILAQAEARLHRPVPALRATVQLGNQQFDLALADEQAKVNVNVLLEEGERGDVEARLRQALIGSGMGNRVRLRPAVAPDPPQPPSNEPPAPGEPPPQSEPTQWVTSLGGMFDDVPPDRLFTRLPGGSASALESLTCWGTGGLNVLRAPEANLRLATGSAMSGAEVGRLIAARDRLFKPRNANASASSTADAPGPAYAAARDKARTLIAVAHARGTGATSPGLVDGSTCHSLWIVARDRQRAWYSLAVRDANDPRRPRNFCYLW